MGAGADEAVVVVREPGGGGGEDDAWSVREWCVSTGDGSTVRVSAVMARDGQPLLVYAGGDGALSAVALGGGATDGSATAALGLTEAEWARDMSRRLAQRARRPVWMLTGSAPSPRDRPHIERNMFAALTQIPVQSTPEDQPQPLATQQ